MTEKPTIEEIFFQCCKSPPQMLHPKKMQQIRQTIQQTDFRRKKSSHTFDPSSKSNQKLCKEEIL